MQSYTKQTRVKAKRISRDAERISEGITDYFPYFKKQKLRAMHHNMRASAANTNKK